MPPVAPTNCLTLPMAMKSLDNGDCGATFENGLSSIEPQGNAGVCKVSDKLADPGTTGITASELAPRTELLDPPGALVPMGGLLAVEDGSNPGIFGAVCGGVGAGIASAVVSTVTGLTALYKVPAPA